MARSPASRGLRHIFIGGFRVVRCWHGAGGNGDDREGNRAGVRKLTGSSPAISPLIGFADMSKDQEIVPQIRSNPDGSRDIICGDKSFTFHGDGSVSVHAGKIKTIGIKNIIDLAAYSVSRRDNLIIHQFSFSSGADGEIVFTNSGEIKTFRFRGGMSLSQAGDIILFGEPPTTPAVGSAN